MDAISSSDTASGPVPQSDMFDDLDEQGEQLLGSLHLGPTEEEPARRGAASRANSVRFDESALHGSSWSGHNARHSGDFGTTRPGSGFMMERSLSHKSDGRHSSAGHSVHSHYSVASGRASSLGLDTGFATGDEEDEDSLSITEPPVSFYVLGTVPSIVRCWLTTNYAHATLLYADICTGSQKSTLDQSLIKELDLTDEVQRDIDGIQRIRLNVYFAEAVVTQRSGRSTSPERLVPSMSVVFEVVNSEATSYSGESKTGIRTFIGSDALRAHSADVLFSRNLMVLQGNDRSRLRVPFVRPEDENAFRYISTTHSLPEKPKLNANAAPFILSDSEPAQEPLAPGPDQDEERQNGFVSLTAARPSAVKLPDPTGPSDAKSDSEKSGKPATEVDFTSKESGSASDISRRESSTGIWGSWRNSGSAGDGPQGTNGPLSGYQPAARGGRNMKVLKPQKASSARTGAAYEPAPSGKPAVEGRRKSLASSVGDGGSGGNNRWEGKRVVSSGVEEKSPAPSNNDSRSNGALPRSANPVGGASAFSWMTPPGKTKN